PVRLNPDVPVKLEEIIFKALEKDRNLRYQSASEMRADLQRLQRDASTTYVTPASKKSRKWIWPVAALVILFMVAAMFWTWRERKMSNGASPSVSVAPSIAVLPFVDMSPNKNQEYFADGVAEQLLNELSKNPKLRVVARTSAFAFKGKNEDLREIGRK